jgi:hypothetical protein
VSCKDKPVNKLDSSKWRTNARVRLPWRGVKALALVFFVGKALLGFSFSRQVAHAFFLTLGFSGDKDEMASEELIDGSAILEVHCSLVEVGLPSVDCDTLHVSTAECTLSTRERYRSKLGACLDSFVPILVMSSRIAKKRSRQSNFASKSPKFAVAGL